MKLGLLTIGDHRADQRTTHQDKLAHTAAVDLSTLTDDEHIVKKGTYWKRGA